MQKNNSNNLNQEYEINLIEFFNLLINSKKIIIITTLIFTLIAIGYVYLLKPSYDAQSVVKLGFYTDSDNDKLPIKPPKEVIDDLKMQFIELPKYKRGMSDLSSIEFIGNNNTTEDFRFIVLKSNAAIASQAIKKIEIAQEFLINDHQILIDNNVKKLELLVAVINKQITKNHDSLELLKMKHNNKIREKKERIDKYYKDLEFQKKDIANLKKRLSNGASMEDLMFKKKEIAIQKNYLEMKNMQKLELDIDDEISSVEKKDLIEMKNVVTENILNANLEIINLEREYIEMNRNVNLELDKMNRSKMSLESAIIYEEKLITQSEDNAFLKEMENQENNIERQIQLKLNEAAQLKSIIQEKRYSNTNVFTGIRTNLVEVSKIMLTLVGFITGLMLSIFFVFIRQTFLQEQK